MSDDEDFEEQLRQEEIASKNEKLDEDRTRIDPDGTVYEWDAEKRAWFPKIDANFIAQYQMTYGSTGENKPSDTLVKTQEQYAKTGELPDVNSKEYAEWYNYYYGAEAQQQTSQPDDTSIPPAPADVNSKEYYDWYYKYYGADVTQDTARTTDTDQDTYWDQYLVEGETKTDVKSNENSGEKGTKKGKAAEKRKPPEPPSWFDVNEDKNTNIYISGLPQEITLEEFQVLMNKCGLIMYDPITRKPKLKLYKDENGKNKGDGRCCYIKPESVTLALQILDGSEYNGNIIYVERAKFELKGNFDPNKRRRKLTKNEKKKFQEKQSKLFDWRPDKPIGTRERYERIVILKNVFDPKEFETDPKLIMELQVELKEECTKYGEVKKVQVYDRHVDGVVAVTFKEPEEADVCVDALNGRWFAKRQLAAQNHDGKSKYHVNETDKEQEERLKQWENFLEGKEPNEAVSGDCESTDKEAKPECSGLTTKSAESSVSNENATVTTDVGAAASHVAMETESAGIAPVQSGSDPADHEGQ